MSFCIDVINCCSDDEKHCYDTLNQNFNLILGLYTPRRRAPMHCWSRITSIAGFRKHKIAWNSIELEHSYTMMIKGRLRNRYPLIFSREQLPYWRVMRIILIRRLCATGQNRKIYFSEKQGKTATIRSDWRRDRTIQEPRRNYTCRGTEISHNDQAWLGRRYNDFRWHGACPWARHCYVGTDILASQAQGLVLRWNQCTLKSITASSVVRALLVYNDAPPEAVKSKRRGSSTTRMAISIRTLLMSHVRRPSPWLLLQSPRE